MSESPHFSYELAFDRNLGWLTEWEQLALRGKCVAIAGMGGVGGVHLLTQARLGIGAFHIADFDRFELANFNRQVGATMQTIGRAKVDVLGEMARGINPELRIERFAAGVNPQNIDEFLQGVHLFVDGFDFFEIDIRRRVFARCAELGIPAITAAPIGMGAALLIFTPGGMSFEEYFRFEGRPEHEQHIRFLVGLTPRGLHRAYLVDPSRLDLAARRGPSTAAACELCAGVAAVAALKLLLGRGGVKPAPYHHHFDAYRDKLVLSRLPFGNAGPMQQLKLALGRRAYARATERAPATEEQPYSPSSTVEQILNAARWAPSGDNEQPWRFQILGEDAVAVHLTYSTTNVYEYRAGEPNVLAGGMLLESIRIAASAFGRVMEWHYEGGETERHRIALRFLPASGTAVDPLYSYLGLRSVDRRPYRLRSLTQRERSTLEGVLGDGLRIEWHIPLASRWQFARLSARATDVRLRAPEAFPVHQRIIDWNRRFSPTGIPAGALGLNRPTLSIMRWALQNEERNRLLLRGGTLSTAAQMDYAPILASAGFFAIRTTRSAATPDERVHMLLEAGRSLQRFWLTASKLGLAMQPGLAILIFAHYGEHAIPFTSDADVARRASRLAAEFRRAFGAGTDDFVFMGRIGEPRPQRLPCRSTRRPLPDLIQGEDKPTRPAAPSA